MKKLNFWLLASLFMGSLAFTACSSSDGDGGGGSEPEPGPVTPPAKFAAVSGIVTSDDGSILRGVTITSGGEVTKSGTNGAYTLNSVTVVNNRAVIKFEKDGYATVIRSCPVGDALYMDVSMNKIEAAPPFDSSTGETVQMNYSQYNPTTGSWENVTMKVELPANGYVVAKADGTASTEVYNGTVTANSVYLNPNEADFADKMPGDLTTNDDRQLVSLGMVAVDLRGSANQKLQLKDNTTATLTFPVPSNIKINPADMRYIPLWSFNEATGVWDYEGEAEYDSELNAYVGTVSHFSWHNLDYPEARAALKVKVVDSNGAPIPSLQVDIDGQRIAYTNSEGIASCVVPSKTDLLIRVASSSYGNYAEDENGNYDESKVVKQNVTLNPQETKTIQLQMPSKAPVIRGTINNTGGGSNVCTIWIQYGPQETNRVISDLNGNYSIVAPSSYRGAAKLIALFGDGSKVETDFTVTDADQTINVDVNKDVPAGAGVVVVVGDGINTWYSIPGGTSGVWDGQITVDERGFTASFYVQISDGDKSQAGWGDVSINIPDYDASKTTFDNVNNNFRYMLEGMGGWTQIESSGQGVKIQVTKNGDVYSFKVNGNGTLIDRSLGIDYDDKAPVQISAEFSIKNTPSSAKRR